jgi:small subunit ribosomal protein S4
LTGENLLTLLERRLDNAVYRAGFAVSRRDARQLVRHGHVLLNGKKTNIPSLLVRENDVIELGKGKGLSRVAHAVEVSEGRQGVKWLNVDKENLKATVTAMPARDDIDMEFNEQLVVELYSK